MRYFWQYKIHLTCYSLLVFAFFLTACQSRQSPAKLAERALILEDWILPEQTDLLVEQLQVFPNGSQVSIALIQHGTPRYLGISRDSDSLVRCVNQEAVFEIGSISKVFTATLLASFVVDSALSLQESINPHLDFKLKDDVQITFESLSNHTSGLPRMPSNFMWSSVLSPSNPYKHYDAAKLQEYLTDELEFEYNPGTRSSYSNLGAGLLAFTLTQFSKKDYQTLLQERILSRLQMTRTTTVKTEVEEWLISGRDKDGDVTANWASGVLLGAGGIYSTTTDLSRFALAQFDSSYQAANLTRQVSFEDPKGNDAGLGWSIIANKSGSTWYWHNGGTGGYSSSMAVDVERQTAVIILSNISSYHDESRRIDDLCFGLMKTLEKHTE